MSYFGRNSLMCPHGDEAGKCGLCYDEWKATGVTPEPVGTFGEVEDARNAAATPPEPISVVEQVRRETVAYFMGKSEGRHYG